MKKNFNYVRIFFRIFLIIAILFSSQILASSKNDDHYLILTFSKKYYFNQLNTYEKEIYLNLLNSKDKFINNEKIYCIELDYENQFETYSNYLEKSIYAYIFDNPESTLWLWTQNYRFSYETVNGTNYLYIAPDTDSNAYTDFSNEELDSRINAVEKLTSDFVTSLSGTNKEKYLKINNWILQNSEYAEDLVENDLAYTSNNLYSALIDKSTICSGFSFAFKYICDLANLPCIYLTGFDFVRTYHAWNVVFVDDQWKVIDLTLNLGREKASFISLSSCPYTVGMFDGAEFSFSYPSLITS